VSLATLEENCRKVAVWRVKYCDTQHSPMNVLPTQIGYHEDNRNGGGINPDRTEELAETVFPKFRLKEAEHDAILLRAMPKDIQSWELPKAALEKGAAASAPAEGWPNLQAGYFFSQNADQIGNDDRMRVAPPGCAELHFWAMGHNHLSHSCKNVMLGAVPRRESLQKFCDMSGHFSAELVAAKHSSLSPVFKTGWSWEVLHCVFAIEEPTGPRILQAVLNDTNAVPMLPSYYNLALSFGRYNAEEDRLGRKLCYETVATKARAEGFHNVATKEDMRKVFDWVISAGGESGPYWPEVKAFGRKYAGSTARKLHPDQYAVSAEFFKAEQPRLGLAMWRDAWMTSAAGAGGFCKGRPFGALRRFFRKATITQL